MSTTNIPGLEKSKDWLNHRVMEIPNTSEISPKFGILELGKLNNSNYIENPRENYYLAKYNQKKALAHVLLSQRF